MCNLPTTQRLQYAVCLSNGLLRPLYTAKLIADFSSFFSVAHQLSCIWALQEEVAVMGTAVSARRRLVFILWPYCTDRIEKKKHVRFSVAKQ